MEHDSVEDNVELAESGELHHQCQLAPGESKICMSGGSIGQKTMKCGRKAYILWAAF